MSVGEAVLLLVAGHPDSPDEARPDPSPEDSVFTEETTTDAIEMSTFNTLEDQGLVLSEDTIGQKGELFYCFK